MSFSFESPTAPRSRSTSPLPTPRELQSPMRNTGDSLAKENQRLRQIIKEKDQLIESLNEKLASITSFSSKRISQLQDHVTATPNLRLNPLASPIQQYTEDVPQRDPRHNWSPTTPTKRTPRMSTVSSNYSFADSVVLGSSPRKAPPKNIDLLVQPENLDTTRVSVESVIDPKYCQKKSVDPVVSLSVNYVDEFTRKRLFSIEKTLSQLRELQVRFKLGELPDKSLFAKNTPASLHERYSKVSKMFDEMSLSGEKPKEAEKFCEFLSSNAVFEMDDPMSQTEILLRKSGRLHSSSWKIVYFKHTEEVISVSETSNDKKPLLLDLKECMVSLDDECGSAFAIETRKKSGLKNRLILCCQSQEKAKNWVSKLSEFTCFDLDNDVSSKVAYTPSIKSEYPSIKSDYPSTPTTPYTAEDESSKKKFNLFKRPPPGVQTAPTAQSVGVSTPFVTNLENEQFSGPLPQFQVNEYVADSKVFGTTLQRSLIAGSYEMDGVQVPSVLYRCILYLERENAVYQEGIFRLSGVSSEISKLQNQFDTTGDCDLFEFLPDVHSVSTLLKRYLRTLEERVFTAQVAIELNNASSKIDINSQQDQDFYDSVAQEFRVSLTKLPEENYNFLKVLFRYLHDVMDHSQYNKMGIKNLSILFATNFQLSQETVVELLCDYLYVFNFSDEVVDSEKRPPVMK